MKIEIKNIREAKKFLKKFTNDIKKYLKKKKKLIVLFKGDLGYGKTTFIKEIGKNLGIKEILKSPAFVIWQIYKFKLDKKDYFLNHIDIYRIEPKDLFKLSFRKKIKENNNLFLIEWGEKLEKYLKSYIIFDIKKEDKKRIVSIEWKNL
ncbi:MAG: tRNA (adenosine(37)-N6)-threonylcarbamoyltransferase complex ATPase subunit type 1 TsaE [Minisyncoccia bacterium]